MIIATLESMGSALWKAAPEWEVGMEGGGGCGDLNQDTVPPFQSPFLFQMSLQVRQLLERARNTENQEVGGMETARKHGLVGSDVTLSTS